MFYFGVDYYPEQWPEERWPIDAGLMAEAGFNVVRLAEFAWSAMEPVEGKYNFDWLDKAIAILNAQGMQVVLGTPTASPPAWLMTKYPELFRVRDDGVRITYGHRREYCPNNPLYHEYSRRIVTRMAEHYADHPAVMGWQIDNEFGDRCYCPVCTRGFQAWLCKRYESVEKLNERWGTIFWSHTYNAWNEIPVPLTTGGSPNPALALDFYRFSSDSYVAYQQIQIDILRERCPQHFITHNLMGFGYDRINYFDLTRNLDFVSWDNYRRLQWNMQAEVDPSRGALDADTMRGLKRQNFWVMEQQAGSGGWEYVSVTPRPGELRLWAYQSIAHGADGIVFFRWRTARYGTEQYWHGLLDHDGHLSRRYQEIKQMGAELKRMGEQIRGSTVKASVAMLLSYDSRFAFQVQGNNPQFNYTAYFHRLYRAFHSHNISIDVVSLTDDLSAYKLVIAPALHLLSKEAADNLTHFVQAGGVLMVGPRTGVKDDANAVVNSRLPGLLADLCGITVEEYDSLAPNVNQPLSFTTVALVNDRPAIAQVWCDILTVHSAEVIARYTDDYYAGKPAITANRVGAGHVLYVGTLGDDRLYEMLAGWLLDLAKLPSRLAANGLEIAQRWQGSQRLLFLMNHTAQPKQVSLDTTFINLADNTTIPPTMLTIPPRDVFVLLENTYSLRDG